MNTRWLWVPIVLISGGALVTLLTAGLSGQMQGGPLLGSVTGVFLSLCSLPFLRRDESEEAAALTDGLHRLESERSEFENQRSGIEEWRDAIREELDEQAARIEVRERRLAEQFAAHQEVFEFPVATHSHISADEHVRLSEKDRRVLEMLEEEAAAVYEKIREDAYTRDDEVDIDLIRSEVLDLVTRVARVYSPDSENPLLETSFEQLARAAGRICLHSLVILEQLPLDVKQYNINSMHSYIRKAILSYGAYQKAAPWLSRLSRGAYAGRFLAGANPLTLGAWFVATEVGKRAGAMAVSSFVDRQAIGLLHSLIRIIGFEIANIYGGDFRHRDPNWVYGAELTELVRRFPLSRDSLRESLRQVSALPLRSEYDRIYLYRCLADHRAAGLALADPALLTRSEREQIAHNLEQFFHGFVHGAEKKVVDEWRSDFEQRFDMKLKLQDGPSPLAPDRTPECVQSIESFLRTVVGLPDAEVTRRMAASQLNQKLGDRPEPIGGALEPFQPPDLDPSDPAVDRFLEDLIRVVVPVINGDRQIEGLLEETGSYFRRPVEEVRELIDQTFVTWVTARFAENAPIRKIPSELARGLAAAEPSASWVFAYPDLAWSDGETNIEIPDAWLVATADAAGGVRLQVFRCSASEPVWQATQPIASRDHGFLIDDCRLTGGRFLVADYPDAAPLIVVGTIRGGGYNRWFGSLLAACRTE